jgi:hypothetical protein
VEVVVKEEEAGGEAWRTRLSVTFGSSIAANRTDECGMGDGGRETTATDGRRGNTRGATPSEGDAAAGLRDALRETMPMEASESSGRRRNTRKSTGSVVTKLSLVCGSSAA